MTIWIGTLCGGLGGSVRGVLALYQRIASWLQRRRDAHKSRPDSRPRFVDAADWGAELIGMGTQVVIGCLVGAFLTRTGTVTGVSGAILTGVSAPAILAQLGQVRLTHHLVTDQSGNQIAPVILTAGVTEATMPATIDGSEPEGATHGG